MNIRAGKRRQLWRQFAGGSSGWAVLPGRSGYLRRFRALTQRIAQSLWQGGTMSSFAGLRNLLVVHGVITLAAAIVLTVSPGLIPGVAGVRLERNDYLL